MTTKPLADLIRSFKAQIALDVDHLEALKRYFEDDEHPCVIEATQQLRRQHVLLRLLKMPVEQLFEVMLMDNSEDIRQALDAEEMDDIVLACMVIDSAERVAKGSQIEFEFTILTLRCVYYLAPLLK